MQKCHRWLAVAAAAIAVNTLAAERTVPPQFWTGLQANIEKSCVDRRGQLDAVARLGPEGIELVCQCTANETVEKLQSTSDMSNAMLANDRSTMSHLLSQATKRPDGKPVLVWCAEQAYARLGKTANPAPTQANAAKSGGPAMPALSAEKGLKGKSREQFLVTSGPACHADITRRLAGIGVGFEDIDRACRCIGNRMADALSEQDLAEIVRTRTMSKDLIATRSQVMTGCVGEALK